MSVAPESLAVPPCAPLSPRPSRPSRLSRAADGTRIIEVDHGETRAAEAVGPRRLSLVSAVDLDKAAVVFGAAGGDGSDVSSGVGAIFSTSVSARDHLHGAPAWKTETALEILQRSDSLAKDVAARGRETCSTHEKKAEDMAAGIRLTSMRSLMMVHPQSGVRILWDLWTCVVLLYISLAVPIAVSFDVPSNPVTSAIEGAIDVMFAFDILLNFRTGYIDEHDGRTVMDPRATARRYLRGWFFLDLTTSVPIDRFVSSVSGLGNLQVGRVAPGWLQAVGGL